MAGLAETLRRGETADAFAEAEGLHRRALAIRRRLLGREHPDVAASLTGLGITLHKQNSPDAESCFRKAIKIQRAALGPGHPDLAYTLNNLGMNLRVKMIKLDEAESSLREALSIQRELFGKHRSTAYSLNFLGDLLCIQGRPIEAEAMHREAAAMQRKVLGDNPEIAISLEYLGNSLKAQLKLEAAKAAYLEALNIRRSLLGADHSLTRNLSKVLEQLYEAQERSDAVALAWQWITQISKWCREPSVMPAAPPEIGNK
jgi:tetratricopeptide (TPR) repeat protein